MIIKIGDKTKVSMEVLGIADFPFSANELKTKYKIRLKQNHPDISKQGSEKTIQIIEAYKHLKNLVFENIEDIDEKALDGVDEDDMFDLTKTCEKCNGWGKVTKDVWVPGICKLCNGTGVELVKCKYCKDGKFTARSGRIVPCKACKGTGIWKKVRCTWCQMDLFGHYEQKSLHCYACDGKGKVKLDLWNPVIPKGAILKS